MFCPNCGTANDDNAKFCHKCGQQLGSATPSPQGGAPDERLRGGGQVVATGDKRYATGKNPTVALILSLVIVGVGQFYNGDVKKGAVMLVGGIVLVLLTAGIGWIPVWIWSMYDAYQVASGKSALW